MGHDDLAAGFPLEGGYLPGEVAAGDPGAGPSGGWQRLGETTLGRLFMNSAYSPVAFGQCTAICS
jgi:hypothetical protein